MLEPGCNTLLVSRLAACARNRNIKCHYKRRNTITEVQFRPYKTTIVHALQPRDPVARLDLCNYRLQSVQIGEIYQEFTFFTDEALLLFL
jgi:hypothetical protein